MEKGLGASGGNNKIDCETGQPWPLLPSRPEKVVRAGVNSR